MNDLTPDQIDFLKDMLRSEGWKIYEALNKKAAEDYRAMATQRPDALTENMRTWYSGLAEGRIEAIEDIKSRLT